MTNHDPIVDGLSARALLAIGLVLLVGSLLAYGWTDDPAVNFVVSTVPFWASVVLFVKAYGRRHRH